MFTIIGLVSNFADILEFPDDFCAVISLQAGEIVLRVKL
jgi:hypothetical protein